MATLNPAYTTPRPVRADQVRVGDEIAARGFLCNFRLAAEDELAQGDVGWYPVADVVGHDEQHIDILSPGEDGWTVSADTPVMVREMVVPGSADVEQRAALAERVRIVGYLRDMADRERRGDFNGRIVAQVVDEVASRVNAFGDRPSPEPRAPSHGRTLAACWSPEEAAILAMPAPKGYRCPVCTHGTALHRMHGCDVGDCDCAAPHGRVLPGDPDPTTT